MFENRLRLLLLIFLLPVIAVVARLAQLQILRAESYRNTAQAMLIKPKRLYPCLRGDIVDRQGQLLAGDAESWDISVHYGALSKSETYLRSLAQKRLRARGVKRTEDHLAAEIEQLTLEMADAWVTIADLTGTPIAELDRIAERRIYKVELTKKIVSKNRGVETRIAEEEMYHPVVRNLDQAAQVTARLELTDYSWVEVQDSHARRYHGGEAVGHLFGLMGEVGPDDQANDPNIDDPLLKYLSGDLMGTIGLEKLGEHWLRGRRGCEQYTLDGQAAIDPIEPVNGKTMTLTIDLELQQTCYRLLADAVEQYPFSTGGSAVILDIPSREALAVVSYPSYDPNSSYAERIRLSEEDPFGQPHLFRAVRRAYPPGSTVKPMVLAAALTDGLVNSSTEFFCRGHLFADYPNRWRCDARWGHGQVSALLSIQKSCNIYYYNVGERMGVPRLREKIQDLVVPNHAEALARDALERHRIDLQGVGPCTQGIDLPLELA